MLTAQPSRSPDAAEPSNVIVLTPSDCLAGRKPLIFDYLTPREHDIVRRRCVPQLARRHSTIYRQGEVQKGIYLIVSGSVRVYYVAPTGREITRAYWFAGNFVGGPDVFAESRSMWTATAMRDSSLLLIPGDVLRSLCAQIPNLAIGLIEAMIFKNRCFSATAQMLGTRSASERMKRVLLLLAEMYGPSAGAADRISVPITHEEIAHMIGSTRQWVTIGLKRLEAAGLLEVGRGHLHIRKDIEALLPQALED